MFSIGDFARHGQVSVRMLRHYDALGLLRPARVDHATGYRYYQASQLARLNRIIALKDLGFTLQQVRSMLDEQVTAEELRGMLRLRRAELAAQLEADAARLRQVEARLSAIESEGRMPADEVQLKPLPAVRLAELTGVAAGYQPTHITPVVRPLYDDLVGRLRRAGVAIAGPAIAYYEDSPDGGVTVHAGMTVNAAPSDAHDFTIMDLPAVTSAATIVHRGPMDDVLKTYDALARWIEASGYRTAGPAREFYIEAAPDECEAWVTELQTPVVPA